MTDIERLIEEELERLAIAYRMGASTDKVVRRIQHLERMKRARKDTLRSLQDCK